MKTRNYIKASKGTRVSACSTSGVGPYARIELFGPTGRDARIGMFPTRDEKRIQIRYVRQQERERIKREKGLNSGLIRAILDANPNLYLEQAKLIAEETGTV